MAAALVVAPTSLEPHAQGRLGVLARRGSLHGRRLLVVLVDAPLTPLRLIGWSLTVIVAAGALAALAYASGILYAIGVAIFH